MTFAPSANTGFADRGDLQKGRLPRTLRVPGTLSVSFLAKLRSEELVGNLIR